MDPPLNRISGCLRKTYKSRRSQVTGDGHPRLRRTTQLSQDSWNLHKALFTSNQEADIDPGDQTNNQDNDNDTIMVDTEDDW